MRLRYVAPALFLTLLAGFSGSRLYTVHQAMDEVQTAWNQCVRVDRLLPPLMNELAHAAQLKGAYVSFGTVQALQTSAAYATYGDLPSDIWRQQDLMSNYDADQIRAGQALLAATEEFYGPLQMVGWGGLSSLQSRIEGTQSYVMASHAAYNQAAIRYYRLTRDWPDRLLIKLTAWPRAEDVAMFSVMSGGQIKDPTENLGNDTCTHPDADGDCD